MTKKLGNRDAALLKPFPTLSFHLYQHLLKKRKKFDNYQKFENYFSYMSLISCKVYLEISFHFLAHIFLGVQ